MNLSLTHKELISVFWDKKATGRVELREISSSERSVEAAKALAIGWGLAIFCILIPVLHFVLVPLFLILGIFWALKKWKTVQEVVTGGFACPACGKETSLEKSSARFPREERCSSCFVTVELKEIN